MCYILCVFHSNFLNYGRTRYTCHVTRQRVRLVYCCVINYWRLTTLKLVSHSRPYQLKGSLRGLLDHPYNTSAIAIYMTCAGEC